MKNLKKLIKNHKYLIFMDFEGTQFSHEMIAIGAVVATIDKKNRIKKMKAPFKEYVRAKNKIGNYVIQLTGITESMLRAKGVEFVTAMQNFKKYCGKAFNDATFVTFGTHDLRILNQTIAYNLAYDKATTSVIQKNYFDFTSLLNEFIKDDKNNALSLVHACELFNIKECGEAHDPSVDAINLANLYNAFIREKTLVLDEYIKVLQKDNSLPEPVGKALKKLANGKDVSAQDFVGFCKEYIDD